MKTESIIYLITVRNNCKYVNNNKMVFFRVVVFQVFYFTR